MTSTRLHAAVPAAALAALLALSGCSEPGEDTGGGGGPEGGSASGQDPSGEASEGEEGSVLDLLVAPLPDDGVIEESGVYNCNDGEATIAGGDLSVVLRGACTAVTLEGAGADVLATGVDGATVTIEGSDTSSVFGQVSALTVNGDNTDVTVVGPTEVQENAQGATVTEVPSRDALEAQLGQVEERVEEGLRDRLGDFGTELEDLGTELEELGTRLEGLGG